MNLTQLKYFNAVCAYKKVSEAAKHLHISQPSLSNAIKDLENEFGITLFSRQHSGMQLTKEGEVLLNLSRDILGRVEHAEHIMNDLGSERKILRLGVPPMIGSLVMSRIFNDFKFRHPDINLEITESGREELLHRLNEDYLDMIFMPHNETLDTDLSRIHISKLEIVCCASEKNPISKMDFVKPSDLTEVPLVLFKNSFFQTEQIKNWFALSNVNPDILLQTEQLSTVQTLISDNMAVGFLFKELIKETNGLCSVPLSTPMYVDVSLVWKKHSYMLGCMKKFKDYIENNSLFSDCNIYK